MIRFLEKSDTDILRDLWKNSYGEAFTDFFFPRFLEDGKTWVLEENGAFTAAVSYRQYGILLHGKNLRYGLLLAPQSLYEGKEEILIKAVKDILSHVDLITLSVDHPVYREEGFQAVYPEAKLVFSPGEIPYREGDYREEASLEDLVHVYWAYASVFEGVRVRDEAMMKELLDYGDTLSWRSLAVYEEEELCAYALYQEEETVSVKELVYTDVRSLKMILGKLLSSGKDVSVTLSQREAEVLFPEKEIEETSGVLAFLQDPDTCRILFQTDVTDIADVFRGHPARHMERW